MMAENYGDPYFGVNKDGHLCVKTRGADTKPGQDIDVLSVIQKAKASTTADSNKVQSPMILRFPEVLKHRLDSLHSAFDNAMEHSGYREPKYQGVFPVKASQDKDVILDLVGFGYDRSYGLQASSKQELEIAVSCLANAKPDAYLVCTGHKDADYIALALSARASKHMNAIIVMEAEEELDMVMEQSSKLGIEPVIGVRAKLHTRIPAHFGDTADSYKHGKVGLPAEKIYAVAEKLQDMDKLHWLKLLHFHIGSMIPTTHILHDAVSEAGDIYCTLVNRYGAEMTTLDCGGGLAVDYGDTRSGRSGMSASYGLEEYASTIVQAAKLKCADHGVPCPVLCTESGRGIVSHHSMVILVLDPFSQSPEQLKHEDHTHEQMPSNFHHHNSSKARPKAFSVDATGMFSHAAADLKKHGEEMYTHAGKHHKRVTDDDSTEYNYGMDFSVFSMTPDFFSVRAMFPMTPVRQPSADGKRTTGDASDDYIYDVNLSVFSLTPDFFDVRQLFPTTLASRHTSDSDKEHGKFIETSEKQRADNYVAVLMSGADQEALSLNQDQFGGLKTVRVSTAGDGDFEIASGEQGPMTDEIMEATITYEVKEEISGDGEV